MYIEETECAGIIKREGTIEREWDQTNQGIQTKCSVKHNTRFLDTNDTIQIDTNDYKNELFLSMASYFQSIVVSSGKKTSFQLTRFICLRNVIGRDKRMWVVCVNAGKAIDEEEEEELPMTTNLCNIRKLSWEETQLSILVFVSVCPHEGEERDGDGGSGGSL